MNKEIIAFSAFGIFLGTLGFAQEMYVVKRRDKLSEIVKRRFQGEKIYGKNGSLEKVIALNPKIKDPNKIYVNQIIRLTPDETVVPVSIAPTFDMIPKLPLEPKLEISPVEILREWTVSVLYGARYLSASQKGALGNTDGGGFLLNNLKLNSEYRFENWSGWLQLETYKFTVDSIDSNITTPMYSIDLGASYNWILASIGKEQTPLFRNNSDNIQMTKQSLAYIAIGAKKDIRLSMSTPTILKFKSWFKYALANSSANSNVELSSVHGFGLCGQMELNREIYAKDSYSLNATWMTDIGYQKISQHVDWATSSGNINSTFNYASTAIGLGLKF